MQPKRKKLYKKNGARSDLFKELWNAAVALRGSIEPADYKRYVLPLIFLRFLSLRYEQRGDEVPEMAYGERDGDRYQHTEGIKLSGRRLPADIPKSKLVGSSITKLDPKKQLREAGYPFDHIGSELIRLDGKFEMVSRDVASLAQKIEGETKSVVDKIEETKRWLVEHVENLFSKKFLWLVGTFIGGVAVLYAILGFLKTLALPDSALVAIAAVGGIIILVASTLLSQKRG